MRRSKRCVHKGSCKGVYECKAQRHDAKVQEQEDAVLLKLLRLAI